MRSSASSTSTRSTSSSPPSRRSSSSPASATGSRARRRSSAPSSRPSPGCTTRRRSSASSADSACRSPSRSSPRPTRSSPRRSSASTATSGAPCSRAAGSTCSPTPARSPGVLDPADVHPTAGRAVADPAVRRGRDGLHLLDRPRGKVSSHLMYRIPRQWHHSTGIQFESIDASESLRLIEPVVAELGYTGQISFDFLVTDDGLSYVECNPRATDGALLLAAGRDRDAACSSRTPTPSCSSPARRRSSTWRWSATRSPTAWSASRRRSATWPGSRTPATAGTTRCRRSTRPSRSPTSPASAIATTRSSRTRWTPTCRWDGEPIEGMSDADAKLLAELRDG